MPQEHWDVGHASSLSTTSPYLFLSLFLLTWNMISTIAGVALIHEDPMAIEVPQKKVWFYYTSLAAFPGFCVVFMGIKCYFSFWYQKRTYCWIGKLIEAAVFDAIFVIMGTLYLAGDNLPIFICSGMMDDDAKEICREQSSIIIGSSLLLHAAIYLAGALKVKSTLVPIYPVTGRIRKAYQSILQLGSVTIFLDQTFSTVVRFITNLNIEDIETINCPSECIVGTSASNCLISLNWKVGGFLIGLICITSLIVIWIIGKNWNDYCCCCREKDTSRHCCENFLIIAFYVLLIVFMAIYTLADNRWLWRCVIEDEFGDMSFYWRIGILVLSLILCTLVMDVMYAAIVCLPGVGIVCKKQGLFRKYACVEIKAKMKESKWECESAFARTASTQSQIIIKNDVRKITVEENYGNVSVTLSVEEDIKCCKGCCYFCEESWECIKSLCKSFWKRLKSLCKRDQEPSQGTRCCQCSCTCEELNKYWRMPEKLETALVVALSTDERDIDIALIPINSPREVAASQEPGAQTRQGASVNPQPAATPIPSASPSTRGPSQGSDPPVTSGSSVMSTTFNSQ